METGCPFCDPPEDDILLSNDQAYVIYDRYPVTEGHALVITHRHVQSYFEATPEERDGLWNLVGEAKVLLDEWSPDGYNIGINIGEAAGQTVMHLHIHLIPRRRGDVEDPRGGVRGAVPGRMSY